MATLSGKPGKVHLDDTNQGFNRYNVIDRSVPEIDNSTTLSRKNTSRYWYVQWQLFNYVPPDFGKCEHHTLSGEWVQ